MNSGFRQLASPIRRRADATPGETHLRYHYPDQTVGETVESASADSGEAVVDAAQPLRREIAGRLGGESSHPVQAPSVLAAHDLYKSFYKGKHEIEVLKGVNMDVPLNQFTVILGQSGSGKSTLLHLLGTLDAPDKGEIHFDGNRIDNLPSARKEALRNRQFGMIFQFYHLLPELTMLENVLVPRMIGDGMIRYWLNRRKYIERAKHLLNQVGLSHRLKHKPNQLSGGEMQRTAIARALMANPQLLLADEPTGNLDEKTGRGILDILRTLNAEQSLTIVMVTHDISIAQKAHHVVTLTNGQVEPGHEPS